jgi:hypothetical protein
MRGCQRRVIALVVALMLVGPRNVRSQEMQMDDTASSVAFGASAIPLMTIASPGFAGRTLSEGYLTQPMVMAMLRTPKERFSANVTVDLEGLTLKRGELNAGVYGEGYVDRRHPHTYVHELVGTGTFGGGLSRFSVTMGKGFVPFGTDDPMSRPFVKYPVNHHLAQVLERALIVGAVASGPLTIEASAFNGDEPESPSDMPNWDRFADSWSARVTARHPLGVEAQASVAHVTSPEQPHAGGLDHRKLSASLRFERDNMYLMSEWARTREMDNDDVAFSFASFLAEGSIRVRAVSIAMRAERTERPEEERAADVFRTPRPHSDLSILGRTRWNVLTASIARDVSIRQLHVAPFLEVSTQAPHSIVTPSAFDPPSFYGARPLWSYSFGARIGIGMKHARMGRYGVAAVAAKHEMVHDMEDM